ncbi:hypothetical protein SDC9_129213 [bioreactor metagenome]|uniref:Chromosome partition protein Smc n=1 Tax=bioreactor metagenome TaxID=1076179 RepID=A0A645D017_9ZZZZ
MTCKNPTAEFKTFELIRDEDITTATYERMDAAARYIREMNSNFSQKMDFLGGKIDVLGGKMDSLGERVDFLGGKIDVLGGKIDSLGGKIDVLGGKVDSFGGKIDVLGNKIDLARIEITSEIRISRDSLRSRLDERISVIERELALIKSKVAT